MVDKTENQEIKPETPAEPSIFGTTTGLPPVVPPTVTVPSELTELVGEGKKYKDVTSALASIPHAQEHIKSLEGSLKELRDDLAKRETAEQLLEKLERKASEGSPQGSQPLSTQDLEGLVSKVLDSKESAKKQEDNISLVDAEMKKVYGDKATEALVGKAKELSLSIKEMQGLAARSPQAFLALFKVMQLSTSDRTSALNTEGVTPQSNEKNFAFFQKLRKENPTQYYSPSIQQEMHRRAKEAGEKFYA